MNEDIIKEFSSDIQSLWKTKVSDDDFVNKVVQDKTKLANFFDVISRHKNEAMPLGILIRTQDSQV